MAILQVLSLILLTLFTLPSTVLANTITFYNYGPENLYAHFTPDCTDNSAGVQTFCFNSYPDLLIPANTPHNGGNGVVQTFESTGWSGNFYTYDQGASVLPVGVLSEFTFKPNTWTSYDVSTIVVDTQNRKQEDGVHFLFPKYGNGGNRVSGCTAFPCPWCYSADAAEPNGRNGVHTCSTGDVDLITYVGVGSPSP